MHIIAGRFRSRALVAPKGQVTKPTTGKVREAIFNICQNSIENALFLDLFAGSGAMGIEAMSRGAKKATFVDNNREAIHCLKRNIEAFAIQDDSLILFGDVLTKIKILVDKGMQFDIIYADPPYGLVDTKGFSYSENIIRFVDTHPCLLLAGGSLFIEESLEAAPKISDLASLKLEKTRHFGRSIVQQYKKAPRE